MKVVTMLSKAFHKPVDSVIFNRFSGGKKQNKIIYIVERSMLKYIWETLKLKLKNLQKISVNELPREIWEEL